MHQIISYLVDWILHIDRHLYALTEQYGVWIYVILFIVLFCETGLVVTPFMPGDSLLFTLGAMAAGGYLDIRILCGLVTCGVLLGDNANYWVGRWVGPKVFDRKEGLFFKKEYLERTHAFYEKHGARAIIFARFIPIIRTFAPFVAGIGTMRYTKFLSYSVVGVVAWILGLMFGGYFLGNHPFVKKHFEIMVFAIIGISFVPLIIEVAKVKLMVKR